MEGVQRGIGHAVCGHSGKDEEEGVGDEWARVLGKAEGGPEGPKTGGMVRQKRQQTLLLQHSIFFGILLGVYGDKLGEDGLGGVICDSKRGSDTDNVLRPGSPERLVNLPADQLVEDAIIHLERGNLGVRSRRFSR